MLIDLQYSVFPRCQALSMHLFCEQLSSHILTVSCVLIIK